MTLEELALELGGLLPGGRLGLSYGLFAQLFPPGEQDAAAREVCFNFARKHGCRVDWAQGQLWFVREASFWRGFFMPRSPSGRSR
jgi:hypothetical protein